jgi:hypothetical protein
MQVYMENVCRSFVTKHLYNAIKNSEYQGIFGLLRELINAEAGDYFNWMGNLLFKVLAVRFLIEA